MTKRSLLLSFYGILVLGVACTFALGWLGLALAACCFLFSLVAGTWVSFEPGPVSNGGLEERIKALETRVNDELVKRAFEGTRR